MLGNVPVSGVCASTADCQNSSNRSSSSFEQVVETTIREAEAEAVATIASSTMFLRSLFCSRVSSASLLPRLLFIFEVKFEGKFDFRSSTKSRFACFVPMLAIASSSSASFSLDSLRQFSVHSSSSATGLLFVSILLLLSAMVCSMSFVDVSACRDSIPLSFSLSPAETRFEKSAVSKEAN